MACLQQGQRLSACFDPLFTFVIAPDNGVVLLHRVPRTPSAALIQMTKNGFWIPELVEEHKAELNLKDEFGMTPIMYALIAGHDDVVLKFIDFGIDISSPLVDVESRNNRDSKFFRELEAQEVKFPMLMMLESGSADPATVERMAEAGALTGIPDLDDPVLTLQGCREAIMQDSNCFGFLLRQVLSKKPTESAEAMRLLSLARICLAAAFHEQPGAALCAAVEIGAAAQAFSDKIRLQDTDSSLAFSAESQNVGACVGALVSTLADEMDREQLFRSVPGCDAVPQRSVCEPRRPAVAGRAYCDSLS